MIRIDPDLPTTLKIDHVIPGIVVSYGIPCKDCILLYHRTVSVSVTERQTLKAFVSKLLS